MKRVLFRVIALAGFLGLALGLLPLLAWIHPTASLWAKASSIALAYLFATVLLLSAGSIIETIVLLFLTTAAILALQFTAGDRAGPFIRLLGWSMRCAAWYAPILLASLVQLFGVEHDPNPRHQP